MIITNCHGGLGNQMFQYSFAKLFFENTDLEHKLYTGDISSYRTQRDFDLSAAFTIAEEVIHDRHTLIEHLGYVLGSKVLRRIVPSIYGPMFKNWQVITDRDQFCVIKEKYKNYFIDGYFQNHSMLEHKHSYIRSIFQFKLHNMPPAVSRYSSNLADFSSIALHVRRGDYLTDARAARIHGVLGMDYYLTAVRLARSKLPDAPVYVFTDDKDWAKSTFLHKIPNAVVVDLDECHPYYDMYLMSLADINIIANSSFSWWSAYLNSKLDNTVFAPKKWYADGRESIFIPSTWHRI